MTVDSEQMYSLGGAQGLHPHACLIFDDFEAYRRVAFNFICEGLTENEKCIMAVERYHQTFIEEDFFRAGLRLADYTETGRLTIIDAQASYAAGASFEPEQTIQVWGEETRRAVENNFTALRVAGEATFALGNTELGEKLVYYENIINQVLFRRFPFKSLCVYDKNLYPPDIIKKVIRAHPAFFYNDEFFPENIHYVPPEIHFKGRKSDMEIDAWLENVRENNRNLEMAKKSDARFRRMFETAPVCCQSLDGKGCFVEVNDTWLTHFGYERQDIIGKSFEAVVHPEWRARFRGKFSRFMSLGEMSGYELRMVRKDGSFVLTSLHGTTETLAGSEIRIAHCMLQDVTAARKAEKEREHALSLLESVLETTADGILITDEQGLPIVFNRKFVDLWGIPEHIRQSGSNSGIVRYAVHQAKDPDAFEAELTVISRESDAVCHDTVALHDGRVFAYDTGPRYLKDRIVGRVWCFREVTGQRQKT